MFRNTEALIRLRRSKRFLALIVVILVSPSVLARGQELNSSGQAAGGTEFGRILEAVDVDGDTVDLTGMFLLRDENEKPAAAYDQINGVYSGRAYFFDAAGVVNGFGEYVDGLREGRWIWYYSNGAEKRTIEYQHGKQHGKYYAYLPNGHLEFYARFQNGRQAGKTIQFLSSFNSVAVEDLPVFYPNEEDLIAGAETLIGSMNGAASMWFATHGGTFPVHPNEIPFLDITDMSDYMDAFKINDLLFTYSGSESSYVLYVYYEGHLLLYYDSVDGTSRRP